MISLGSKDELPELDSPRSGGQVSESAHDYSAVSDDEIDQAMADFLKNDSYG